MTEPLAAWVELPQFLDERGCLSAIDFSLLLFAPRRLFYVDNVPMGTKRGGHAHREATQFLICLSGHIQVELRRGIERCTVVCEPLGRGLVIRPRIWAQQTYLEAGSTLLVICSHSYDLDSYIADAEPSP